MAQFSFNVSVVGRNPKNGKPGNAVASAAYIAREALVDDHTGDIHDYSRKGGFEYKDIYTPENAPAWMRDRQKLWNEVEHREDLSSRPDDAQVARRIIAALPHELNQRERIWLVKDFAREMARRGMVVDFAIHEPDSHGDQRNYHVHMLLTMRSVNSQGFGNKVREWNDKENVNAWRDRWAELGAKALERAGHQEEAERYRVSHGTLENQRKEALKRGDVDHAEKLDRKPTRHMGPRASAMEREKGMVTEKGDMNRSIRAKNEEREFARGIARIRKQSPLFTPEERDLHWDILKASATPGMAAVRETGEHLGERPNKKKRKEPILHPEFTHAIRKNKARVSAKAQRIGMIGGNVAGLAIEGLAKGIESLFNAPMTPEQQQNFADAQAKREQDARDAEHSRGGRGRD